MRTYQGPPLYKAKTRLAADRQQYRQHSERTTTQQVAPQMNTHMMAIQGEGKDEDGKAQRRVHLRRERSNKLPTNVWIRLAGPHCGRRKG